MITLEEAKTYMQIPESDTSKDVLIEVYIDYVTEAIETYCNNVFVLKTFTDLPVDTFHLGEGDASHEIILKGFPVRDVTVKELDRTLVNKSDYQISLDSGVIYSPVYPDNSFSDYTVTYTVGYAPADMPKVLKFVALNAVKELFDANGESSTSGGSGGAIKSKSLGDFSITYETGTSNGNAGDASNIIESVISKNTYILNKYKRYPI